MLSKLIFGRKTTGKIGVIDLDVTINENHEFTCDVTSVPVEEGVNVSDHIIKEPEKLTMTGFVTNTPVPSFGELREFFTRADWGNRSQIAFEEMLKILGHGENLQEAIRKKSIEVDVYTSMKLYRGMTLVRFNVPRDRNSHDAIEFAAEFTKVYKVKSKLVLIDDVNENKASRISEQGTSKVDTGKQTTEEVSRESSAFRLARNLRDRIYQ